MRLVNWRLLKLGISWGLVLGLGLTVLGGLIGMRWWVKNWGWLFELLGLGLGLVYMINYSEEIRKIKEVKELIAKYGLWVYVVILVWLGWMVTVWWASGRGGDEELMTLLKGNGYGDGTGSLRAVIEAIYMSLKLVGYGLVVVLGYRFMTTRKH